jgi:hypothetical protein
LVQLVLLVEMFDKLDTAKQTEHASGAKEEVCSESVTNAVGVFHKDSHDTNHNTRKEHDTDGSTNGVGQASLVQP